MQRSCVVFSRDFHFYKMKWLIYLKIVLRSCFIIPGKSIYIHSLHVVAHCHHKSTLFWFDSSFYKLLELYTMQMNWGKLYFIDTDARSLWSHQKVLTLFLLSLSCLNSSLFLIRLVCLVYYLIHTGKMRKLSEDPIKMSGMLDIFFASQQI